MRSPLIPVLVVIAGLALAWLWWTRESDAPPRSVTTAVATANRNAPSPAASNVVSTNLPVGTRESPPAPSTAPATSAANASPAPSAPTASAQAKPPQSALSDPARPLSTRESVATTVPTPADEGEHATDTASTSDDDAAANAGETEKPADSPAGDESAKDDSTSSAAPSPDNAAGGDAPADGEASSPDAQPADESTPSDANGEAGATAEPPKAEPPDTGHAADLVAAWMAQQDASDEADDPSSRRALHAFDKEATDPAWASSTARDIEASLSDWVGTLAPDDRSRVRVLHVECRLSYCQVLGAETGLHGAETQVFSRAADYLSQQPWWSELRFTNHTMAANLDSESGYMLYQLYLQRDTTPGG